MNINDVIIKPVLTEKATQLARNNVYAFQIHEKANKFQIAEALEKLYKVKVGEVRILTKKGKERRVGKRMQTKKVMPDKKVAYITVKEGKIDLFPQA